MPSQRVPLASGFAGLNRMIAPQDMPESLSPDTTDARSSNLKMGALGPRNGRYVVTNAPSQKPLGGMGTLHLPYTKYRVLTTNDGLWHTDALQELGATLPATAPDLFGMSQFQQFIGSASAVFNTRTRFQQYRNRLYAFNGRNRMRCLDGTTWTNAGIDKVAAAPVVAAGAEVPTTLIEAYVLSMGVMTITSTAHSDTVGQSVNLIFGDQFYSGAFIIASVPDANTFTYPFTLADVGVVVGNQQQGHSNTAVIHLTSVARAGQVATFYTGDTSGLQVGQLVTIVCSESGFNHVVGVSAIAGDGKSFGGVYPKASTSGGDVSKTACIGTATVLPVDNFPTIVYSSAYVATSSTATITTAAAHGLKVGQYVWLLWNDGVGGYGTGVTETTQEQSGVFAISTVPTSTTFTLSMTSASVSSTTSAPQFQCIAFQYGVVGNSDGTRGGGLQTTGTFYYFLAPANSKHLDVEGRPVEGIPTDISAALTLLNQPGTITIPATHPDPQVDTWNIYRNKNGVISTDLTSDQQDFFLIGSVAIGTTTFSDGKSDDDLTGAYRLRFNQNVPPAFKFGAIYGDRMFGGGFDPILVNTMFAAVDADTTKINFFQSTVTGVTGDAATDVFTSAGHGYNDGDQIYFTVFTGGAGLAKAVLYYLVNTTTDTFSLATTSGGVTVDFTTDVSAGVLFRTYATFLGATAPIMDDGIVGAWFRVDGESVQYRIIARPSPGTIQLDAPYAGALAGASLAIFRYPWEIYFSEFGDVEAWGPDGEGLRNTISIPGRQHLTGMIEWQGSVLLFTHHNIYAIQGKGPNLTDIRLLPDPIFMGMGALGGDAIVRVDNDIFFLSARGPCVIVAGAAPQLIGVTLNTDWIDSLTELQYGLCCAGTDDKDVYFCVPGVGLYGNSKTYRYERYTQTWWEELEMNPVAFIREDGDFGALNQLYYLQGRFVMQPNRGITDVTQSQTILRGTPTSHTSTTMTDTATSMNVTVVDECYIHFYLAGKLVGSRRIIEAPSNPFHTVTWSSDATLPGGGTVAFSYDAYAIGEIAWRWTTKTLEQPSVVIDVDSVHITFDAIVAAGTIQKTDITNGALSGTTHSATAKQKATKLIACRGCRDYAAVIGSNTGAAIRHVYAEVIVEADNK